MNNEEELRQRIAELEEENSRLLFANRHNTDLYEMRKADHEKAEAQCAAMRKQLWEGLPRLALCIDALEKMGRVVVDIDSLPEFARIKRNIEKALSSDAGAELLERLRKLEDAARMRPMDDPELERIKKSGSGILIAYDGEVGEASYEGGLWFSPTMGDVCDPDGWWPLPEVGE